MHPRRRVVDASVAVKWYFEDPLTAQAEAVLAAPGELLAADLLVTEIAATALDRLRRGEIGEELAQSILLELLQAPIEWHPAAELAAAALALAPPLGLSMPEAVHVALAVRSGCPLVSADRRLYESVAGGPLAAQVVWLGDFSG